MLSGLGLGGSFGCIMTFALPISLSICSEESRPDVARGLVAGIIAAPFSLFAVAAVMGYGFGDVLRLGLPAFAVAAILALLLTFCRDAAVRGCLLVGRLMMAAFVVLLACAAIEHWFSVTLIPGMAPIGRQLEIVGEIGVMLSGAFPMVKFAERHFGGAIRGLARLLRIDSTASLGMIVSIANPLPMYVTLNRMTPEGRVVCSACSVSLGTTSGLSPLRIRRAPFRCSRERSSPRSLRSRSRCSLSGRGAANGRRRPPARRKRRIVAFTSAPLLIKTHRS